MGNVRKLTDPQTFILEVQPRDVDGNPAPVDGVPTWDVNDSGLCTLTPAADGMSARVTKVGPLGHVKVSLKADPDLGPGVREIIGEYEFDYVSGEAVTVALVPKEESTT